MDDFVRNKLTEWGLSDLIEKFKDEGIDKESLLCLEDQDFEELIPKVGQRAKFRSRLKLLKEELNQEAECVSNCKQKHQEAPDCAQAGPSMSTSRKKGNRTMDHHSELQPLPKRQRPGFIGSNSEEESLLINVKSIMRNVCDKLHLKENTKLNAILKTKISQINDFKSDKREVIGVFGRTGTGKSSLINAVIGEFDLLPFGRIKACTSVMIKVEDNTKNDKYEAEIEFITPEEWKDELSSFYINCENNQTTNDKEKNSDIDDKLSAVYGEEWKNISYENLTDNQFFEEIPEFLCHRSVRAKTLACDSAKELSDKLVQYTKSKSSNVAVKRWYWPLVKCVTVRVPDNPLLQHVTLVDLPGCGDRNKSRDKMWEEFVGSCSTVWIVTDVNRAASDKEAWNILESTCSLIGNGGQCQRIHFICTHTDESENWKNDNIDAKKEVLKAFNKQNIVKKHFRDECFEVFTVSSTEFKERKRLQPDETEIPKLQEFLHNLNCHSETFKYVSGAYGILSLMQGALSRHTADIKTEVCSQLEEKLQYELHKITKKMEETYKSLGKCLTEGVKNSERSCEETLQSVIYPEQCGSSFHRTLKCIVERSGVHKPRNGKLIDLNAELSSKLTGSIDEMFRNTFPNEGICSQFNGVISEFSLDTEKLIEKYRPVELQLIFLKTEEQDIQTKLNEITLEEKKKVYRSLTETIKEAMKAGYEKAAEFSGQDTLRNMRETLEDHVSDAKYFMFEDAKDEMLQKLKKLMETIKDTLEKSLNKSIELSLKTDDRLNIPDLTAELEQVEQYYNKLKNNNKKMVAH